MNNGLNRQFGSTVDIKPHFYLKLGPGPVAEATRFPIDRFHVHDVGI